MVVLTIYHQGLLNTQTPAQPTNSCVFFSPPPPIDFIDKKGLLNERERERKRERKRGREREREREREE